MNQPEVGILGGIQAIFWPSGFFRDVVANATTGCGKIRTWRRVDGLTDAAVAV